MLQTVSKMKFSLAVVFVIGIVYVMADEDSLPQCQTEWNRVEAVAQEYLEKTGHYAIGTIRPTCLEDGTYASKQCKGSVCNCVAADGTSLTEDFNIGIAVETSCKCARERHEYTQKNLVGLEHRCTERGSYEPMQCTGSVCYCVDKEGQQLGSKTVNRGFADKLKCGQ